MTVQRTAQLIYFAEKAGWLTYVVGSTMSYNASESK